MNYNCIEHKLRVFISSKCGGKYTIARKALKKLLDSTGLVETYVFESEPASSEDTKSAYLEYVDGSNLCVFLIDNEDGVPAAVLSEEKRAKDKKLRLLYLFCDENEKKSTPMQQGIKVSLSQKYRVVHEFSDLVTTAYDSILQDVIAVYKRKDSALINGDNEDSDNNKRQIIKDHFFLPYNNKISFPYVYRVLTENIIPIDPTEDQKESELEIKLSEQLKIVLYKKEYDDSLFDKICDEASKKYNTIISDFFKIRFEAQKAYYCSKYTECFELLKKSIQIALENDNIPIWIANDIAIDLRYIQGLIDEGNNRILLENIGQKYIDESEEPVFYPLLDRQIENMQEYISDYYYKQLNISPYVTTYGGIKPIFNCLANAFVIAELNGSILQTEITRDRLISIYSMLCTLYGDHDLIVEYVRLLVVNRERKKLDELLRTYNKSMSILNEFDISDILGSVNCIPNSIHQTMSKYLLISRFGYYFDDITYKELYDDLLQYAMRWTEDGNRVVNLSIYIFEFFNENNYRVIYNDVIDFVCQLFDQKLEYYYSNCLKTLRNIDFFKVKPDLQKKVKNVFIELLSEENDCCDNQFFSDAVITFCKSTNIPYDDLEEKIVANKPQYYKDTFLLEFLFERRENPIKYIDIQLGEALQRNKFQGKNGCYLQYSYEPFDTLYNIIVFGKLKIEKELLKKIINVVMETLNMENQTISSKKSGLKLLQLLYHSYKEMEIWKSVYEKMIDNVSVITDGKNVRFGSDETNNILLFQYKLFICSFDEKQQNQMIEKLYSLDTDDSYDIIQFLKVIGMYLESLDSDTSNSDMIASFLYYSIIMSKHKEQDVKFYSVKCLIELTKFDFAKNLALIHLSQIMDTGSETIKVAILKRISRIYADNDYITQIVNLGKADNNFFVRYVADNKCDNIVK